MLIYQSFVTTPRPRGIAGILTFGPANSCYKSHTGGDSQLLKPRQSFPAVSYVMNDVKKSNALNVINGTNTLLFGEDMHNW